MIRIVDKKAVSTFVMILLILISIIFGAIMSYLWVMGSYYNMPESSILVVKYANFSDTDFSYFNVTILNPSNSLFDVNITGIRLAIEEKNETYVIKETEPDTLPFLLPRGAEHTFKCKKNWSNFAGETVKIEPMAENALITSFICTTPDANLYFRPEFDETKSVRYFNVTVVNSGTVNLTLSEIRLFGITINENLTPPLTTPLSLTPSQEAEFGCNYNWENLRGQNITFFVKTLENYEITYTTGKLSGAVLEIQDVKFDYFSTYYFNLTIKSLEDSTADATISKISLILENQTKVEINQTIPPIGTPSSFNIIPKKENRTFMCYWNWMEYRNKSITVEAYSNEGFTIPSKTIRTPPEVIWNITHVMFEFEDTLHFSVNITNLPCSLYGINITEIRVNQTSVNMNATFLNPGESKNIPCAFNWTDFIGKKANISVSESSGQKISITMNIPAVSLEIIENQFVCGDLRDRYPNITMPFPIPYFNITISNSNNSLLDVTLIGVQIKINNETFEVDYNLTYPIIGSNGYPLKKGESVTFMCFWDWTKYKEIEKFTVVVYTKEGFYTSKTLQVAI